MVNTRRQEEPLRDTFFIPDFDRTEVKVWLGLVDFSEVTPHGCGPTDLEFIPERLGPEK